MRKVIVTCPCGQRMQVSRSAYGKIGVCPKCNQKIRVGAGGVEPLALPSPEEPPPPRHHDVPNSHEQPRPEFEAAKRRFGRAVNLFYHDHYAEALAILDDLRKELPGNVQIETARTRCIERMAAPPPKKEEIMTAPIKAEFGEKTEFGERAEPGEPPPEEKPSEPEPVEEKEQEAEAPPADAPADGLGEKLTATAVHETLLYLLKEGSPDAVRLEAAELACRVLGLGGPRHRASSNGKRRQSPEPAERAAPTRQT